MCAPQGRVKLFFLISKPVLLWAQRLLKRIMPCCLSCDIVLRFLHFLCATFRSDLRHFVGSVSGSRRPRGFCLLDVLVAWLLSRLL